jgi:ribonuclease HI
MEPERTELPEVAIHTDGACIGNPGPGGYGVVLEFGRHRKTLSGGYRLTTNNRMEMMALIVGLKALKRRCKVTIYSDSEILVDGIMKRTAYRARAKGWKVGKKVKRNSDLWCELLDLCDRHVVELVWLPGHSGHRDNELADQLAKAAARQSDLLVDEAFEEGNTTRRDPELAFG